MPNKIEILNAAQAIVRRKTDGKYLLLRSGEWPERPERSLKHDLPGGEVEVGETFEQGMVRELQEETGIVAEEKLLQPVYSVTYLSQHESCSINRIIFLVEVDDVAVTLSWEHVEYEWMPLDELLAVDDIRPPYPDIFQYLAKIDVLV